VVLGVDFENDGSFTGLCKEDLDYWKGQFENDELISLGTSYLASKESWEFKLNDQNELIEILL
jgi:hypothetical protein